MINKTHGYPCRHFYRIMTLTPTARFHIGLVNRRWYKDTLQEADISNNTFVVVSSLNISISKAVSLPTRFLYSTNGFDVQVEGLAAIDNNEISKSISKKRKFGELWGIGRKVMIDAIEDENEDNYRELLKFFSSIQRKSQQNIINNNNINSNSNNGDGDDIMDIRNPIARRPKGRPKSKRIKGSLEQSDVGSSKIQYKCKLCKQKGHNSKTCKEQNKENNDER